MVPTSEEITALLRAWREGSEEAESRIVSELYPELKALARREAGRWNRLSLQPTEIVNELYMRLRGGPQPDWEDRTHFFAIASRLIRNILVDNARRRGTQKRGAGVVHLDLDHALAVGTDEGIDLLELDSALGRLAHADPTAARLVELRYFGGLEINEAASVLSTSTSTLVRKWRFAKVWLRRELSSPQAAL